VRPVRFRVWSEPNQNESLVQMDVEVLWGFYLLKDKLEMCTKKHGLINRELLGFRMNHTR